MQHIKEVWQNTMSNLITDPRELFTMLQLDPKFLDAAYKACKLFPLRVPLSFIHKMEKGNINDPLLLQILPLHTELSNTPGFSSDPVGEASTNLLPGMLHKYHGRVLLTISSACAVNCRYCFRREFPYAENRPGTTGWEKALNYIAKDTSITEVIYSGGDPLMASDKFLAKLTENISGISHVKRLRIHTRLPIMVPERITSTLINWFTQSPLQPILVIHCNHAQEIDDLTKEKLLFLKRSGIILLNQTVLLKKINDNATTLIKLSETLFNCGVLPYYLHLLDRVQGTAHFEVSESVALDLMKTVRHSLPGYLVPKLVRENAGEKAKSIII